MEDISYLTDHYDKKIERIKQINAPLNFVFITDQHNRLNEHDKGWAIRTTDTLTFELARNHIRSIQYILDRCPEIGFVVSGGDVGNDYDPDVEAYKFSVREVYDELYKLSVPVHCIIGNHDDGFGNCADRGYDYRTHTILPDEMHEICMKYNPTKENYYFIDVEPDYRFIFMNSVDLPYQFDSDGSYPFDWRLEISNKQAVWFEEEALNTDRKIIIFSHAPLHNAGVFGTEGMPLGIKPYDDTLNAPRILYDISRHKNVVANICGHVHFDNIAYNERLLTVSTLCSLVQEWCPACPRRDLGTITETAFDVFSIKDDMMYMTRFGAGRDREAHILFEIK